MGKVQPALTCIVGFSGRLIGLATKPLLQESLSVAHQTAALATRDLERVVVDTTVQPKAIAYPTDARLCHRALENLVDLAQRSRLRPRQSCRRAAKRAAIMVGRFSHAHQFKRARHQLNFLRIRLGRVIHPPQDRRRRAAQGTLHRPPRPGPSGRFQDHHQRGHKVYALHAPRGRVHRQGQGRARTSLAARVSITTPATKPKGGQSIGRLGYGATFDPNE